MSLSISETLDPDKNPRKPFGLKAEATLHRITFNPSSASPESTLYVFIPKLPENMVIVPGSVSLMFNLTVDGHANNTVVNNLGRNLVKRMIVKFGGEIIQDTSRYDLFHTFHDMFLCDEAKVDLLKNGISSEPIRKMRTNAGDKGTDAKQLALAAIHGTKYRIPLDHPILRDHGVFYPRALNQELSFEMTLASVDDIVNYSDTSKKPNYSITNLELEYSCIRSEYLAKQAQSAYLMGRGFLYEHIHLHKTFVVDKANTSVINEHVNVPRRSMTGILCLFVEELKTAGTRDSEKFVNPSILSVKVNLDGVPNKLYSKGMIPSDLWETMKKRVGIGERDALRCPTAHLGVNQKDFYVNNRFALWIDLRTFPDNETHGSGFYLNATRDGVKLEIERKTGGSGNITCYMFVVADALITIEGGNLKSIMY